MSATSKVEYINPEGACAAQGLYSHIGKVSDGPLLFVAGQLSVGADGGVAGVGDFDAQFHQVFDNLEAVLKGVGCDFNDVAKFTTYLVHSQDIDAFMRLRAARFPSMFATSVYPPNTLLIVDRLVKEPFLIEVEAIVRGSVLSDARPLREELTIAGLAPAISHYVHAVRHKDLVFVSGLTAHDEHDALVGEGDAAAQTRKILENLKLVLDAVGASFADILKVTVFLTDIGDRAAINPIRQEFFGTAKPASTLVEVSALALPGMKVEIEAVVGLPTG